MMMMMMMMMNDEDDDDDDDDDEMRRTTRTMVTVTADCVAIILTLVASIILWDRNHLGIIIPFS